MDKLELADEVGGSVESARAGEFQISLCFHRKSQNLNTDDELLTPELKTGKFFRK